MPSWPLDRLSLRTEKCAHSLAQMRVDSTQISVGNCSRSALLTITAPRGQIKSQSWEIGGYLRSWTAKLTSLYGSGAKIQKSIAGFSGGFPFSADCAADDFRRSQLNIEESNGASVAVSSLYEVTATEVRVLANAPGCRAFTARAIQSCPLSLSLFGVKNDGVGPVFA